MQILITGITGFVGSHLAEYLLGREEEFKVHGIRRHFRSSTENIVSILDKIELHECDIKDPSAVREVMEAVRPDIIFHLAAQSFVQDSFSSPLVTLATNVEGTLNILEAVRELRARDATYNPFIHIAGSSEEYGLVEKDEIPIKEENPLRPLSPYGVSKVAQEHIALQYWRSYGLRAIVTRAFNHTGPRRGDVFATSNFAKQIAEIEAGKRPPLLFHGNLETVRDFTDVRDMVKAYLLVVLHGKPGEVYNICSGRGYSIRQVVDILRDFSGVRLEMRPDPGRMRPSDVPLLVGSFEKFNRATGWKPSIPFSQTLRDLLEYWRSKVGIGS